MNDHYLAPFASPSRHLASAEIIRARSSNRQDIRQVALEGLELGAMTRVLDLGCGFGFMSEAVATRLHPQATVLGIDALSENGPAFLKSVSSTGRRAEFTALTIGSRLPVESQGYDLVISSYSLYFFAAALPDIPRLLRPDGLFLAVTHSRRSFRSLVFALGHDPESSPIVRLISQFCAENGEELLQRHFGDIQRIDYPNHLCFDDRHRDELLAYVRFKLPLLMPPAQPSREVPVWMQRALATSLSQPGGLVVEKDDVIFRCWRPRWP